MIDITINNKKTKIETLKLQEFKNLTIVPVATTPDFNGDLLSLSKGMDLGLVKVIECKPATVGTIIVENNAVTPLILINGEEVLGAKQNRIFSGTVIIPPKTTQKVSVCCVEHGRWAYERPSRVENFSRNPFQEVNEEYDDNQTSQLTSSEFFSKSSNFSNASLRRKHDEGRKECKNVQQDVWNEVKELEERSNFYSNTSSLQDNYKDKSAQIDEYFSYFPCLKEQTGIIAILNGEILAFEFFNSPEIYRNYHEKLVKSYIIEAIADYDVKKIVKINQEDIKKFVSEINICNISKDLTQSVGLGEDIILDSEFGSGRIKMCEGSNIHTSYFKKQ